MKNYVAIIHKEDDSDYGVTFPDFPGCISAGSTLDEAKEMATEALADHIEILLEEGESIPEPSSLDTIMAEPDFQDGVAVMIEYSHSAKRIRFNVTASERELKKIDQYAESRGYTRSGFLMAAARRQMEEEESLLTG